MHDDIDKMIADALSAEDRALLERYGEEGGFFAQATGALRGPMAGMMWLIYIAQAILFISGVVLAWRFFQASDVLAALRLGLSATVLVTIASVLKSALGTHAETNRIIREVKRLELQVALLNSKIASAR